MNQNYSQSIQENLINPLKKIFYQHQRLIFICIGIFIHIVILMPFLNLNGIFVQDDFAFHRLRLESYVTAVQQGDFFPRIFPNMANNLGYAADLFYPSILLLPYVILRFIGLNYIQSYYGFQLIISISTFCISYLSIRKLKQSNSTAFLFALIYSTATYRLLDQFIRGALGETMAFIFFPIILWGFYDILKGRSKYGVVLAIGMSLLFYSHLITTLLVCIALFIACLYYLFSKELNWSKIMVIVKAAIIAILLCSFTLFPMLEQAYWVEFNFENASGIWSDALNYSLGELLIDSITNSSAVWSDLAPNVGTLLIGIFIYTLINYRKQSLRIRSLTVISLLLILVSTNIFPWTLIRHTFIGTIQFPWRILTLVTVALSVLASFKIAEHRSLIQKTLITSLLVAIVSVSYSGNIIHQFEQNDSNFVTNETYADFFLNSVGGGREYIPVVADFDYLRDLDNPMPQHSEQVQSKKISEQYKTTTYEISSSNDDEAVILPKLAYAGYQVRVNDQPTELTQANGLIQINIPSGTHQVITDYVGTRIQHITLYVSLLSWAALIVAGIFTFRTKSRQ